jgi:hypothetical protein
MEAEGDTIAIASVELPPFRSVTYVECGINLSLPPIFSPYPKWDARGDRVVLAASEYYEVQVFQEGREVQRVRRDIQPARATMAMVEAEYGEGEKWSIGNARSCTVPTRVAVEARGVADYVPVIRKLALTPDDGGMWVQRTSPKEPKGLIDVFDRDGRYVGTLPPNTPWPAAIGHRRIAVLESDPDGVQSVVVYKISYDRR